LRGILDIFARFREGSIIAGASGISSTIASGISSAIASGISSAIASGISSAIVGS